MLPMKKYSFKEAVADELVPHLPLTREQILDVLELPKNPEWGDYALPCFRLAKTLGRPPEQIASSLMEKLAGRPLFQTVRQQGAYLNFTLQTEWLARNTLQNVYALGKCYGASEEGAGQCVVIDFSSPNIAKPFGIGHLRSTVIGHSLSRIYQALGYHVVRINHLGDWGKQFGILMAGFEQWGEPEKLEKAPLRALYDCYVRACAEIERGNTDFESKADQFFRKMESGDSGVLEQWRFFRDISVKEYEKIYTRLGITFDGYEGESFYNDKTGNLLAHLKQSGLAVLSQGAWVVDLSADILGAAMVQKADETTLYLTRDIAAAQYRFEKYQFQKMLYVVGQPQELHFKQLLKILLRMGLDWCSRCGHVRFGYILGMSTRKGTLVFLDDVLDEARQRALEKMRTSPVGEPVDDQEAVAEIIGRTAVVFNDLSNARIKDVSFDWDRMLSFEGDTGPYLQNAHARICSISRKSGLPVSQEVDFSLLGEPICRRLLNLLALYPEKVQVAARLNEPSVICTYLLELGGTLHSSYRELRVIGSPEPLAKSRMLLYECVKIVLKNGLHLLGLPALERM